MSYVVGPYDKTVYSNPQPPRRWMARQFGIKQAQPINRDLVLPYLRARLTRTTELGPSQDVAASALINDYLDPVLGLNPYCKDPLAAARNKAYERMMDQMRTVAEMGITIATHRQAINMIANRAIQLRKGYSALRQGRFRSFLRTFGMVPKSRHEKLYRTKPKDAANLFLEYHFGWSPLIGDIYAAAEVIQQPYPDKLVFGSSSQDVNHLKHVDEGWQRYTTAVRGKVSVRSQFYASVHNPNLYRANQLGLINPATVIWDVIPFSFIGDWFINMSAFLRSLSDFAGVTISKPMYVEKCFVGCHQVRYEYSRLSWICDEKLVRSERKVGLPAYTLRVKPLKLPSPTRAATAISLLTQLFIKSN